MTDTSCPLCSDPEAKRSAASRGISHDQAIRELLATDRATPTPSCGHTECDTGRCRYS